MREEKREIIKERGNVLYLGMNGIFLVSKKNHQPNKNKTPSHTLSLSLSLSLGLGCYDLGMDDDGNVLRGFYIIYIYNIYIYIVIFLLSLPSLLSSLDKKTKTNLFFSVE